jgi:hypothetical protein
MAFFLTRLNVGDYDAWKPMFDEDTPGARRHALRHRILRNVEEPGEVFILVEFASVEDAKAGRERLLASGALDRFADKTEPKIVEEADAKTY